MIVVRFGRDGLDQYLDAVPRPVTVGFAEALAFQDIPAVTEAADPPWRRR